MIRNSVRKPQKANVGIQPVDRRRIKEKEKNELIRYTIEWFQIWNNGLAWGWERTPTQIQNGGFLFLLFYLSISRGGSNDLHTFLRLIYIYIFLFKKYSFVSFLRLGTIRWEGRTSRVSFERRYLQGISSFPRDKRYERFYHYFRKRGPN